MFRWCIRPQYTLCEAQAEKDGIDLNPYRERLCKEMEEKKKQKARLKLNRPVATITSNEIQGQVDLTGEYPKMFF